MTQLTVIQTSEKYAELTVDTQHEFLLKGLPISIADFFDSRATVLFTRRVMQDDKHRAFTRNQPAGTAELSAAGENSQSVGKSRRNDVVEKSVKFIIGHG